MFVVPTPQHQHAFVDPPPSLRTSSSPLGHSGPEATRSLLSTLNRSSMERSGAPEYQQSGLPSPYPSNYGDNQSEASSADHASAAAAQYANQQEVRPSNYPTAATPNSDYSTYPASARSSTFPEHIQRPYHPAAGPNHSAGSAGMAQQNSPSLPPPPGPQSSATTPSQQQQRGEVAGGGGQTSAGGNSGYGYAASAAAAGGRQLHQPVRSNLPPPADPSIAAPSPTFPYNSQHSPYAAPPPQDMAHGPYPHPPGGLYAQPRPDWAQYNQQHPTPITPNHHVFPQTPTHAAPTSRNQVYSFVPIPGAQQHKRPRRRYEEIERMYKCGWNGCEKAYGTLNHLNAHVTMQSHGQKRTPEEFKEIRKEWKARKKEEDNARKQDEERARQAAAAAAAAAGQANGQPDQQGPPEQGPPPQTYGPPRSVTLPPIGYQPGQYPAPSSAGVPPSQPGSAGLPAEYGPGAPPNHPMYPAGYAQQPPSPYGPPGPAPGQMYSQQPNGTAHHHPPPH